MMVIVEGRRQHCWYCKHLGHLLRNCPQKSTNNINSEKTTCTTNNPAVDDYPKKKKNEPRWPERKLHSDPQNNGTSNRSNNQKSNNNNARTNWTSNIYTKRKSTEKQPEEMETSTKLKGRRDRGEIKVLKICTQPNTLTEKETHQSSPKVTLQLPTVQFAPQQPAPQLPSSEKSPQKTSPTNPSSNPPISPSAWNSPLPNPSLSLTFKAVV